MIAELNLDISINVYKRCIWRFHAKVTIIEIDKTKEKGIKELIKQTSVPYDMHRMRLAAKQRCCREIYIKQQV